MADTGRPTKFTPEVREIILDAIEAGNYFSVACSIAGVDFSTFSRWMKRGRSKAPEDAEFCAFRKAVKRAEAHGEAKQLGHVTTAAESTWQAAAWYLERKYPKRWSRPQTTPPKPAKPLSQMTREELDAYEATVEASRTR
jgi:transposase